MVEGLIAADTARYYATGELPDTARLDGQGDGVMTDRRWKVTVSSLFPNDNRVETVYEGEHPNEEAACHAALTKTAIGNGGSTIDRIEKVEKIG